MGLFNKSLLNPSEQTDYKIFKNYFNRWGERFITDEFTAHIKGKSVLFVAEVLKLFEQTNAQMLIEECVKKSVDPLHLDLVINDVIVKRQLKENRSKVYIAPDGMNEPKLALLQKLKEFSTYIETDYSQIFKSCVHNNSLTEVRYLLILHAENNKKLPVSEAALGRMPRLVLDDLESLYKVCGAEEEKFFKHLIQSSLTAVEDMWKPMIDRVTSYEQSHRLSAEDIEEILSGCKDLERAAYVREKLNFDKALIDREKQKRLVEQHDLPGLAQLLKKDMFNKENREDVETCLKHQLLYEGHDSLETTLKYYGFALDGISTGLLSEHLPAFIGKCPEDKDPGFFLKTVQNHPDANLIYQQVAEYLVGRSAHHAKLDQVFNFHKPDTRQMMEWLERALDYKEFKEICSVLVKNMDEFERPTPLFIRRLIAKDKIEIINAMVEKGFYFRETMPYAKTCTGDETVKSLLGRIEASERDKAFPYWRKKDQDTIVGVSLEGVKNNNEVVTLCTSFNLRAGIATQTFETYKHGELENIEFVGNAMDLSLFKSDYIKEAEQQLQDQGGIRRFPQKPQTTAPLKRQPA